MQTSRFFSWVVLDPARPAENVRRLSQPRESSEVLGQGMFGILRDGSGRVGSGWVTTP